MDRLGAGAHLPIQPQKPPRRTHRGKKGAVSNPVDGQEPITEVSEETPQEDSNAIFRDQVPITLLKTTAQELQSLCDALGSDKEYNNTVFSRIENKIMMSYAEKESNYLDIFHEVVRLIPVLKEHRRANLAVSSLETSNNFANFLIQKINKMDLKPTQGITNLRSDLSDYRASDNFDPNSATATANAISTLLNRLDNLSL
ncbi:hypothetical protein DID80_04265 [Candidatus Marinamargulisbacteria bacterium SCGC AAA071-K20]|nr:hypothetical protein DID80_04265 [Candidatus Marinamargulisbacteria bacterium SCGC AAA071-K20]